MLSRARLFATPWTVARQASLSVRCSMQELWSGLPYLTPRDLPDPGIETAPLASLALAGGFFTTVPLGKPNTVCVPSNDCRILLANFR